MPGIAGIISKDSSRDHRAELRAMLEGMRCEPFYSSGTYLCEAAGVCAGWVCIEGSFSDCMPVVSEDGKVVLLFAGESCADEETRGLLAAAGRRPPTSDARHLLELYEVAGDDFLERLNGWFSGLLIDLRRMRVSVFNDRYGVGRLYCHEAPEALYFSSEARALLKALPRLRRIDPRGLAELVVCGRTMEQRTLFTGVTLLPGGSCWLFRAGQGVAKKRYFSPATWESQGTLEKEEFYARLRETFTGLLPGHFVARQPVAISLTGGLDTRMIMAHAHVGPGALPCYTYGGPYRDSYDVKVARRVAAACGQSHRVIRLDAQFLETFPAHAEKSILATDGSLDAWGASEVFLSARAREVAPVRMTGNYGSEVLRGVDYIKAILPAQDLFAPEFYALARGAAASFDANRRAHLLTHALFEFIPFSLFGRLCAAQSQLTLRTPYMDNRLAGLMYRAPARLLHSNEMSLRLIADGKAEVSRIPTDCGLRVDMRSPWAWITRLYYEALFKAEYYSNEGMPQLGARLVRLAGPWEPERIFMGRHKMEHYRTWFRRDLAPYVREILLDPRTLARPYLNGRAVGEMVERHLAGRGNHTYEINKLLTVELIHRLHVEGRT